MRQVLHRYNAVVISIFFLSCLLLVGCGAKEGKVTQWEVGKLGGSGAQFDDPQRGDSIAKIKIRSYGTIWVRLFPKEAPKAVENFVTHAKKGYYNGVTFHRIINDFMIQGGDPTGTGAGGESIWKKDFEDEFSDMLYPVRGALCMANTGVANTNGSQFFIVQAKPLSKDMIKQVEQQNRISASKDPVKLFQLLYQVTLTKKAAQNYLTVGGTPWLYRKHTVFGQTVAGYDVLDRVAQTKIADEQTGKPEKDVVIEKIQIIKQK